jgi:hypothetical protein
MTESELSKFFGCSRARRLLSLPDQRRVAAAVNLVGAVLDADGTPAECYIQALAVTQLMHERMAALVENAMTP